MQTLNDTYTVVRDGERLEVYNVVNIDQPAVVRGYNPVVETFDARIGAGDSRTKPEAVTKAVAYELEDEFYIDVADHDIEVVDIESDDVEVI
ncbi:hypothetical protein [Haloferax sulfurifontis]|uniref:Uncharacterized protein n=2 Tax=Haloferax sulfurifontis TaxID=255616 RepID=M0IIN7_9EURY|nr:hypothetical protein [Haloferax sulfurifontis]ELZ96615.1 hypothetical protein C441_04584 [Haloferax sulfurifontis ATCC BAA-897]GGC72456.1 hypothetical protein GCM10007209_37980 [Haloferax sulfurifontis]